MTEVLKEYIDPANLPVHWGGELVDSKGDPMCRDRIVIPEGKIPKHLYWKPLPGEPTQDQLSLCSVPAGAVCVCVNENLLFRFKSVQIIYNERRQYYFTLVFTMFARIYRRCFL